MTKMDPTAVEGAVRQIVQHTLKLPDCEISSEMNLRDLPGMESIKILRIVASIEKKFNIRLDDHVVFTMNTIREIAAEIGKLVAADPSP